MAMSFIEYFDLRNRKIDDFVNKQQLQLDRLRIRTDISVDLFEENSAIIFITLLKPMGYIKRTTSSF
jgi:hypothetical protein